MSNVAALSVTMDDVAPSVRDTIRRSRLVGRSVRARGRAIARTIVHARAIVCGRPQRGTERRAKAAATAIVASPSDSLPSALPPPSLMSLFRRNRVRTKLASSCTAAQLSATNSSRPLGRDRSSSGLEIGATAVNSIRLVRSFPILRGFLGTRDARNSLVRAE